MANGDEGRGIFKLAGFPLGIRSEKKMGRIANPEALVDGRNLDLSANSIRTRKGSLTVSTSSLPAGNVVLLKQALFPGAGVTRLVAQVDTGSANKLYGSKTTLPSGSVAFSELYDLTAGADILDFAQLNERAIFTEILNNRPLVWGGVMETNGSDWMTPKSILMTWDGTNYHNYTDDLCDPDTDTTADIGSMTSSSYLYLCFDVPIVGDIYVGVGTANTTESSSASNNTITFTQDGDITTRNLAGTIASWNKDGAATGHFLTSGAARITVGGGGAESEDIDFAATTDFTRHDISGTITNWVQDDGITGHFTNGAAAVTIGPGNTEELVEEGCVVAIGGTDYYIRDIVDDGDGTSEVVLNDSVGSLAIDGIYGVEYVGGYVEVASPAGFNTHGDDESSTTKCTPNQTDGTTPYTVTAKTYLSPGLPYKAFNGTVAAGNGWNGNSTKPQWIKHDFESAPAAKVVVKFRINNLSGSYDWHDYYLEGSNDDSSWTTLATITSDSYAGWSSWKTFRNWTAYRYHRLTVTSADGGTWLNDTEFVEADDTTEVVPTAGHVFHSTDNSQLDSSSITAMYSCNITRTKPGSSAIWHAFSFDDRATWWVYLASAWVNIVKDDGVWKYYDGASWQAASEDNMITALREALLDADNHMSTAAVQAMGQSDWEAANGFDPGVTTTVDVAALLVPDGSDCPKVDKYSFQFSQGDTDEPEVIVGSKIDFGDNEDYYIVSITDDGDADNDIELSTDHASGTIYGIYPAEYDGTLEGIAPAGNAAATTYSMPVACNTALGAHTQDSSDWIHINSITVDQTTPGSSLVYHAFCTNANDSDETWKAYVSGSFVDVAKLDTGTWKYRSTEDDDYTAASSNSRESALHDALILSINQMSKTTLEALTVTEWDTVFSIDQTTFDLAFVMYIDGVNIPHVDGFTINTDSVITVTLEGYNGSWTNIPITMDGTQSSDISLAQSGVIDITASSFTATHLVVEDVVGFWYRLSLASGTSAGTELSTVKFQANCQPLAKLAPDGIPDVAASVIYVDASLVAYKEITQDVSDETEGTAQYLNDGAESPTGMGTSDAIFIGYAVPFNAVRLSVGVNADSQAVENNSETATMTVSYWDGDSWTAASSFSDGTADSGATLAHKGMLTWTEPSDWKQNNPIGGAYPLAYWIKITVSATLTATTSLAEVKIYAVPTDLKKYSHCGTKLDRLMLGNRTDNPAQVDVSRRIEEYGIQSGEDSFSYTPSSQDSIVAICPVYNETFFFTQRHGYLLTGDSPDDFQVERIDVGQQVPINSRCVVMAPAAGQQSNLQVAAYYLNYAGVFSLSGWQTRVFTGLQRQSLGEMTDWWLEDKRPYLDKAYLHLACGEYYADKDLIVWSVPMIVDHALNNATAVSNEGGGKVGFTATAHGLSQSGGDVIYIGGMTNYSGPYTTTSDTTANKIVVTATYTAETTTEAAVWYLASQTTNNMLIAFDVARGAWYPPMDITATAVTTVWERNTSAPGNLGQKMLFAGNGSGEVIHLLDDSYDDDDGTAITWWGKTGWLDFGTPQRKRITKVTCFGLTEGSSVYLKMYINGRKTLISSDWSLSFTGVASLAATRGYTYHLLDPGLHGVYEAQFLFGGTEQSDISFEVEFEVDGGTRALTGTIEDTGHTAYEE